MESTNTTAANMTHVTQVFISTPSQAGMGGPSEMSEICFAVVAVSLSVSTGQTSDRRKAF